MKVVELLMDSAPLKTNPFSDLAKGERAQQLDTAVPSSDPVCRDNNGDGSARHLKCNNNGSDSDSDSDSDGPTELSLLDPVEVTQQLLTAEASITSDADSLNSVRRAPNQSHPLENIPELPRRPPLLPKRRTSESVKRVSILDPGSCSTIETYNFLENRDDTTYTKPLSRLNHQKASKDEALKTSSQTLPRITLVNLTKMQALPANSATKSLSTAYPCSNGKMTSGVGFNSNNPNVHALNSTSKGGRASSLPKITVSESSHDSQASPSLPPLPNRSSFSDPTKTNAAQLLEAYARRSSLSSVDSYSSADDNLSSREYSLDSSEELDKDTLRSLGITDEDIRLQSQIEARYEQVRDEELRIRRQLIHNEMNLPTNDEDHSLLDINTVSRAHSSTSTDENSLTPTMSNSSYSIDIFADGDLTEEEFIKLLPPVPEYTEKALDTELSIPNGKAIDIMQINEHSITEKPPAYSPVSENLRAYIQRPQFSQTGGDTYSYRRRERDSQLRYFRTSLNSRTGSSIVVPLRVSSRSSRRPPPTRSMIPPSINSRY